MIKKFFSLSLVMLVLANVNLAKTEEGGFSFRIEPGYTGIKGIKTEVGSIYNYREDYRPGFEGPSDTFNYGITYTPIDPKLQSKFTLQGEVNYRKDKWEVCANGWWFTSTNTINGKIITPKSFSYGQYYTYYENGVCLWGHTVRPLRNDLEPSRRSPIDYWATNGIRVWTANVLCGSRVLETQKSSLTFYFGIKTAGYKINQECGVKQKAWINDYFGTGTHFLNKNEISSEAEAVARFLVGPTVGAKYAVKIKNLEIKGNISQSVPFGEVSQKGRWRDIDDLYKARGIEGPFEPHLYLIGEYPFLKKEKNAIPITEGSIEFNLIWTIKKISFLTGIGGAVAIWKELPVAPQWQMPGDWTDMEGTHWKTSKETITFYSIIGNVGLGF